MTCCIKNDNSAFLTFAVIPFVIFDSDYALISCPLCNSNTLWNILMVFGRNVFGFNDTSTLVDHFVSSPREREKRDKRDSRRDEREGQGRKRNRNESEETEEIKTFPHYPYLLQG